MLKELNQQQFLEIEHPLSQPLKLHQDQNFYIPERKVILVLEQVRTIQDPVRVGFFAPASLPIFRRKVIERGLTARPQRKDNTITHMTLGFFWGEEVFIGEDVLKFVRLFWPPHKTPSAHFEYRSTQPVNFEFLGEILGPEQIKRLLQFLIS